MRWAGIVVRIVEMRGVYRVLVGKIEGKRPFGRPRRRWSIILRWMLSKWDVGGMDWTDPTQNRERCRALVNAVMNFRVP